MGLFSSMTLNSLDDLLVVQLQDLYDAEQRLTKALPLMADAATNKELKAAFQKHLRETEQHVTRLEKVFSILGQSAKSHTCEAMKGLVEEGNEAINAGGDPEVRDAALIAAAQRVEHYEMAGYGTVRSYARLLNNAKAEQLLQETLEEEKATDAKLTTLAESVINLQAV